jgi:hypothetical protein
VAVPPDIINNNKYVTLSCDIMYVQQILFFITVSHNLHFMTIENIPNRKAQTLIACCDNVFNLYNSRGFVIENVLMDMEFETLCDELTRRNVKLNTTSASEHVPDVECQICVVKEHVRAIYNTLPYKCIPRIMMIEMVNYAVSWLNNFPPKGGVSQTISPRTIFTGVQLDFNKHC